MKTIRCAVFALVFLCIAVAVPVEESPKAKVVEAATQAKTVKAATKDKAAEPKSNPIIIEEVVPVGPEGTENEKSEEEVEKEDESASDKGGAAEGESNAAINLAATGTKAQQASTNFRFESGTLNILAGRDEVVETNIPNPVIFISPVLIGPLNVETSPGIVSRVKREDLGEHTDTEGVVTHKYRFLVTAAVEPCSYQEFEERVDYFIVSARQANSLGDNGKAYVAETSSHASNNRFWVFTANVKLERGMRLGEKFRFGHSTVGKKTWEKKQHNEQYHLTGTAHCLTQIQTRNEEGFLQSNAQGRNNQVTHIRARGTYHEVIRSEAGHVVKESSSQRETVAAFCIADPGDNTPLNLKLGEMDMRFEIVKSLRGPGVFNVTPGDGRTKVVAGGEMAGRQPYHIRAWDTIYSNGVHIFKVQEDKCGNPDLSHNDERVLTASFA